MSWAKYYQTPFLSRNVLLYLSNMWYQLSFITLYPCKQTDNIRPTYCISWDRCSTLQVFIMHLYAARLGSNWRCELAVTRSILTCSQLHHLQDFSLLVVIIFLTIPQQQVMAQEILQLGAIEAKSSRTTRASNNAPPDVTRQRRRHLVVHCDAAIVATGNMTQDPYWKIVHETGRCKNKKQHTIGYESCQYRCRQRKINRRTHSWGTDRATWPIHRCP